MSFAKALVYAECLFVALMLLGLLGHRFQFLPFKVAFGGFALSLLLAALVGLVALVVFGLSFGPLNPAAKSPSLVAFAIGVAPLLLVLVTVGAGFKLPRIHDIATSPGELEFSHAQTLRKPGENSLEPTDDKVIALQRANYPQVKPVISELSPEEAFSLATTVAVDLGWEITHQSPADLRFEAVEKTAIFGFVDDVVVHVTPRESGSQVDLRSVSRVGVSDLGANAKRIKKFIEAFQSQTQ